MPELFAVSGFFYARLLGLGVFVPDKQLSDPAVSQVVLDPDFWWFLGLFMLGLIARKLVSKEPIDWQRFAGEMILAGIGALVFYVTGLLQGMSTLQMIIFACLGSLGGLRAIEWAIKIVLQLKAGKP